MADTRWLRLDAGWMDSDWLAVLSPGARLAWVSLLSYCKLAGTKGSVKALSPIVASRRWDIPADDVSAMLDAATSDGALESDEDGDWVVTAWAHYQEPDKTAADRKRRQRERESADVTPRHGMSRRDTRDEDRDTVTDRDVTRDRGVTRHATETETSTTHTNARARETADPPPSPPSTDDGGSPTTDPEEAKDGPPHTTSTRRGVDARALRAWERWNALGLPLPRSVHEKDHLDGLTELFTGHPRWKPVEVEQALQRLKDEPEEFEWVAGKGPRYLAHKPRGQPQVIEQVLTRKKAQGGRGGSPEPVTTKHPKRLRIE